MLSKQEKIIELSKQLAEKSEEYHKLCNTFENWKYIDGNIDLVSLKEAFLKNQVEINEITAKIFKLKNETYSAFLNFFGVRQ